MALPAGEMLRSTSWESLHTLVPEDALVLSLATEATVAPLPLFGRPLSHYSRLRELPVVSSLSELQLFASVADIKAGQKPLLLLSLHRLHFLKKNAPLWTITGDCDACKVYFKIHTNNLTSYHIVFENAPPIIILNNALRSLCDITIAGTKLRVFGALGAASTFGSGLIRVIALTPDSPSLADSLDLEKSQPPKKLFFKDTDFHKALVRQDRHVVALLVNAGRPLVTVPLALYTDAGGAKSGGVRIDGTIRLFEVADSDGILDDSLRLACVILVLAEQEIRKMRGNNKPTIIE